MRSAEVGEDRVNELMGIHQGGCGVRMMFFGFLLLTACASHGVRCDGHLQPINPPAPAMMPETPAVRSTR